MTAEFRLYLELLFVAAILLSILFVNNIFLYKQKLTDLISLMLISGIATCILEILWVAVDGHPPLRVIAYLCVSLYCAAFVLFAALLNRYLLDRLGIKLGRKWESIGYTLPIAVIALLCLTTPWTRLLFWVDESAIVHTEVFFDTFFQGVVYLYMFTPLLIAIYFLTLGKARRPADGEIPASLFVFGVMAPALYLLELLLLGEGMDVYENTSLPISLALVYLVTNVSTLNALDTQAKMEAVETDLRIASKIQADALPDVAPEFANHLNLNLRGSMYTAKEVGGDFFDYFDIDDNRICFLIADVSGKGTPAALFMMTAKTMIKDYALTHGSTAEIFTAVNARLCENNDAGMFATAWIGILDTRTMALQYTNAGHNYPVFQRRGQPCAEMKKVHGLFLAGMEFTQYRQSELQLEPGDRLLLYTDGIVEAHNRADDLYGMERLEKVLESTRDCPGDQVVARIFEDVNDFATGVPQFDDITMVVLTIKEQAA
jgi:serine phosphatase RsbU (regulator of sigma subunit)